jgi:hypothetical protein
LSIVSDSNNSIGIDHISVRTARVHYFQAWPTDPRIISAILCTTLNAIVQREKITGFLFVWGCKCVARLGNAALGVDNGRGPTATTSAFNVINRTTD